jgi:hypothetical protein
MIGDLDRFPVGYLTQDLTALVSHLAVCDGSHVAQRSTPVREIGGKVSWGAVSEEPTPAVVAALPGWRFKTCGQGAGARVGAPGLGSRLAGRSG